MHFFTFQSVLHVLCTYRKFPQQLEIDISQSEATFYNGVGFATVYRRVYCCKILMASNQVSRYIRKSIRMSFMFLSYRKILIIGSDKSEYLQSLCIY